MNVGGTYFGASGANSSCWVRTVATPVGLRPTLVWNSATASLVLLPK